LDRHDAVDDRCARCDQQFRRWANRLITTVASYYMLYGGWLLVARSSAASF